MRELLQGDLITKLNRDVVSKDLRKLPRDCGSGRARPRPGGAPPPPPPPGQREARNAPKMPEFVTSYWKFPMLPRFLTKKEPFRARPRRRRRLARARGPLRALTAFSEVLTKNFTNLTVPLLLPSADVARPPAAGALAPGRLAPRPQAPGRPGRRARGAGRQSPASASRRREIQQC